MRTRTFTSETWVPRPLLDVFDFFSNAHNLDAITPPWLAFRVLTPPPIIMKAGAIIDYRLKLRGIPINWRTRINAWEPPHRFVDEQIRGPYRRWVHEHAFAAKDGGTLVRDVVEYAVALDFLVHRWLVKPDVEKIFRFRTEALKKRFAPMPPSV